MPRSIFLLVGSILFFSTLVNCGKRIQSDDSSLAVGGLESHGRVKRQMMNLATKWNGGQINYFFTGVFEPIEKNKLMLAAMEYISNRTCIKFVENQNANQRLNILLSSAAGCDSKLGAPGTRSNPSGQEVLNYGGCRRMMSSGVHELSHSLGSIHEHARPDRDNYLIVNETEVRRSGGAAQMNTTPYGMTTLYVPFDHGSCMMYSNLMWGAPLMTTRDPAYERTLGHRRVTFYDMERINKFYNCGCAVNLECQNGGYTSPGDCKKCNCPSGYFGKLCNERRGFDSYELNATSTWQSKKIPFQYTFTGDNYGHFHSTYAYITAPANKEIEVKIEKMENITCMYGCNFAGIEVKTKEDKRITSPLLCCEDQTIAKKSFVSKNNPTIVELFSRDPTGPSAVTFSYRYVDPIRFG
ncbi:unnamed protein product [Caenorhabditis brenneri]